MSSPLRLEIVTDAVLPMASDKCQVEVALSSACPSLEEVNQNPTTWDFICINSELN